MSSGRGRRLICGTSRSQEQLGSQCMCASGMGQIVTSAAHSWILAVRTGGGFGLSFIPTYACSPTAAYVCNGIAV